MNLTELQTVEGLDLLVSGSAAKIKKYAATVGFGNQRVRIIRRGPRLFVYGIKSQKGRSRNRFQLKAGS